MKRCPRCDRSCRGKLGLAIHRSRVHGVRPDRRADRHRQGTVQILVRLAPSDHRALKRMARKSGVAQVEIIRRSIRARARRSLEKA